MEGDLTGETLDRLHKEAEKREQQQKAAEKPGDGTADSREARGRERREAAPTPEQLAERAELRKSIQENIESLPKQKRDLLKDPAATIEITVPTAWAGRYAEMEEILGTLPDVKARNHSFRAEKGMDTSPRPNAAILVDAWGAGAGSEEAERGGTSPERRERISPEEAAERRRIANPDSGIGCPYGGLPGRQSVLDWVEKRMPPEVKEDLKDHNKTVVVEPHTSAPGDKDANMDLRHRRGEFVADILRSLPGVEAKIVVRSQGSAEAAGDPSKDDATERVVLISSAESYSGSGRGERGSELPGSNDIPAEHKRNYVMGPHAAQALYYQARYNFARGDYRGLVRKDDAADSEAHDTDLDRYVTEFQRVARTDPHGALWEVKPWKGFMRDMLEDRRLREPIRNVMNACGYDRTGLTRWAQHWIRRGAG